MESKIAISAAAVPLLLLQRGLSPPFAGERAGGIWLSLVPLCFGGSCLCPVASGAQGNLCCSCQALHPAQPAPDQPHLPLCSPGASAPPPEPMQVSALPHAAQGSQSQSISVCISPLSGDLMVGAGLG